MILRMLIVDDEPLAVHYLVETLEKYPQLQLDMMKAYSGKEALAKATESKVDLLLSDIRMPGMNGMELADRMLERWPRCKVIFLTGYNDFHYVQSAMRKGGVDYVLKTEGDETIVRAIEKAIADVRAEVDEEEVLLKAKQQYSLALPSLRRDYLTEILRGEEESRAVRISWFRKLEIDADPERPVLAALGKIDEWGTFGAPEDRALLFYSIHNIAEEYFKQTVRFVSFQYDRTRLVWLIQPRPDHSYEEAGRTLSSCAELVQMSCSRLLKVPISIAIAAGPSAWGELGERIEALKLLLAFKMGAGQELIITEPGVAANSPKRSSQSLLEIGRLRSALHKLDLLESYMDNGMQESYRQLFRELFAFDEQLIAKAEGKWLGLELFSRLSAFFLAYLNRRELLAVDAIGSAVQTEKLTSPDQHASLQDMIRYFGELGVKVAEYNLKNQTERTNDIIGQVNGYIHQFLHEELTLTRLAEFVYLSPPYLSRMYKQMTGHGLLEYINETRINKAKLLLKTTNKKIHEIAAEVGLESAAYFTRLFRKKTGETPQEYRDSGKGT